MAEIVIDLDSESVGEHFAIVRTSRRQRKRFSEGCVRLVGSAAEALTEADPDRQEYPARVYGPSSSSEGLRLYYLIRWLD